jgi:hypothetical protein
MVSLLISRLGKVISGQTPEAMYKALKSYGYLSETALAEPAAVVMVLKRVQDSWPAMPPDGAEMWRNMEAALGEGGFLSATGHEAAGQYVSRH